MEESIVKERQHRLLAMARGDGQRKEVGTYT